MPGIVQIVTSSVGSIPSKRLLEIRSRRWALLLKASACQQCACVCVSVCLFRFDWSFMLANRDFVVSAIDKFRKTVFGLSPSSIIIFSAACNFCFRLLDQPLKLIEWLAKALFHRMHTEHISIASLCSVRFSAMNFSFQFAFIVHLCVYFTPIFTSVQWTWTTKRYPLSFSHFHGSCASIF